MNDGTTAGFSADTEVLARTRPRIALVRLTLFVISQGGAPLASPSQILAAAKAARAVSGAGQGAPGVSPILTDSGVWSNVYGTGLPRPAPDFQDGAFGPLTPIPAMPIDQPPPGFERPMPRRWQYPVGWNLPGQPRTEGNTLTDFATLRTLASLYSVARACIQLLKSEIRGLEWDVVPTKDAAKAMRGDHKAMRDFGERRSECIRFFKNPDPEYGSWSSWLDTLLEDIYAIDALSVFLRPSRLRGRGLMGSDLAALELISGESIRPLVDLHGSRPSPPSVGFQQYEYGVPRADLMSIMLGADLSEEMKDRKVGEYRGDQLLYLPYTRQTISPYGKPPIEQALVPVMSGLSKQGWQLDFYQEGSIPGLFVSPGDAAMTASQVRELQEALNTISGDIGFKHKIIVLPPGSKTMPQKPPELADQFDQVVSVEVCCATGTKVMTQRGLVSIEDINPGNMVLTHRGRWQPVRRLIRNPVRDEVRRITAKGFDSLEVTGNHPVWTAHYGQTLSHCRFYEHTDWVAARDVHPERSSRRGPMDAVTLPIPVMGSADARLRLSDHIRGRWDDSSVWEEDGWLVHSQSKVKPLPAVVPMGAALGRLLGLYMAEGSAGPYQIEWYFHEDEVAYHQQVIDDLKSVFGLTAKVVPVAGEKCVKVRCNSPVLAELLACGTARVKRLPEWAWGGSPEFYASLLWGWVAGDGTLTPKGWRGATSSLDLAWQMRLVALACGHEPQMRAQRQTKSSINGREIRGADLIYIVEVILEKQKRGTYRIDGPHLTSVVKSNEVIEYADDVVWNLEVEEDESYVTTGGTVHNCMAFQVQPTELGLMPQVATVQSPSAMNQAAKADAARHQRKSLVPMLQFLKQSLLDKVIQVACGQTDMQFLFEGLEEDEDEESLTGLLVEQIGAGLASVDEGRGVLGRDPWGLPVTQDPLWASANGVMLLGSVDPATGQPAGQPAALPSVTQQMQGSIGGSTPMANEGQANPAGALAQGHMPGTTHVPPAQPNREQTPSHSAAIAGAAEASASAAGSRSAKSAARDLLHRYESVVPGDQQSCAKCMLPRHNAVHAITAIKTRQMLAGVPERAVVAELLTAPDAAVLSKTALAVLEPPAPAAPAPVPARTVSAKAALSELDALARHVRKGRDPATWQPVHIPGVVMALITEDVAKGLDVADVLTSARDLLPKAAASPKAPAADSGGQWLTWEHDEALARKYETQIAAAFAAVRKEAGRLFAEWLDGSLPVTAAVLASMVADLLRDRLALILAQLRAEAHALGYQSASQAAGQSQQSPPPQQGMNSLASQAAVRQMSATGMAGLAGALAKALAGGGVTVGVLLALLDKFLRAGSRPYLIALTEVERAIQEGALDAYLQAGIAYVQWVTAHDALVCPACLKAQAASPLPAGSVFPGVNEVKPPAHPRCRCHLAPAPPPAVPPGVTKAAKDWDWKHPDTSLSAGEQVYRQLCEDFPPEAIQWVRRAKWSGPDQVPLSAIDYQPSKWQAGHEPGKVARFREKIEHRTAKGKMGHKPAILADRPGTPSGESLYVVDGHHRVIADHELNRPVDAYVGIVDKADEQAAMETHSSQLKTGTPGSDPYAESPEARKSARGSAEVLREYWTREGHQGPTHWADEEKIRWGEPDDWYRCVDMLTPHIGAEGARGYCNLRHKERLGYWPAQHAEMDRG